MKTFMFPGQGSQARGMGGALFDEFSQVTQKADAILGYSIKELCLEDPRGELNKTQFTQPALYVVNALSYMKKLEESGQPPDFLAGHSLGEFNALLAARCFDFETGLALVSKRGELMSRVSGGAMAAITNATREEVESALQANDLGNIDLANYNTPMQIVISGPREDIARAQAVFQQGKMRYYPLNTSGAFHSRFMSEAMSEFRAYLQAIELGELQIPVISNVTARPYQSGAIRENLSNQIASMVRWSETIQYLLGLGTGAAPMQFEEVGPGDVLTKLAYTIRKLAPPAAASPAPAANAERRKGADATEKVLAWNRNYPVGTEVKSTVAQYEHLETRTEAIVLFGHRAAVYMKGYSGYFDLDEVVPVQERETRA